MSDKQGCWFSFIVALLILLSLCAAALWIMDGLTHGGLFK